MYLVSTRMPGESYRRRLRSFSTCVTYFERQLTHLCVDSAQALWASFCFRFVKKKKKGGGDSTELCVCVCV